MAQAEFHEVFAVDKDRLFSVITRYEDYPEFVDGCTAAKVERKGPGKARVSYEISMIKEVQYTLDHKEDPEKCKMEWNLVESSSFKKNNGFWELKSAGPGKTDVRYCLELEPTFPVPGLILNRLVKGSLPAMVKSFIKRANAD